MDKFGIFNFLNAFKDYVNKNQNETGANSTNQGDPLSKILAGLINGKSAKKDAPTATAESAQRTNTDIKKGETKTVSPLHNQMLATMKSHDEFVKRVKTNEEKKDK